jgi:hypothetical protein
LEEPLGAEPQTFRVKSETGEPETRAVEAKVAMRKALKDCIMKAWNKNNSYCTEEDAVAVADDDGAAAVVDKRGNLSRKTSPLIIMI